MGRLDGPQFLKTRRIHVADASLAVPPGLGFTAVNGTVWYVPSARSLAVFVSGKRRKDNAGPGFERWVNTKWSQGGANQRGMRLHLHSVLQTVLKELSGREFPARDVYLARCNLSGMDVGQFIDSVCTACVCWYCEMSSA